MSTNKGGSGVAATAHICSHHSISEALPVGIAFWRGSTNPNGKQNVKLSFTSQSSYVGFTHRFYLDNELIGGSNWHKNTVEWESSSLSPNRIIDTCENPCSYPQNPPDMLEISEISSTWKALWSLDTSTWNETIRRSINRDDPSNTAPVLLSVAELQ